MKVKKIQKNNELELFKWNTTNVTSLAKNIHFFLMTWLTHTLPRFLLFTTEHYRICIGCCGQVRATETEWVKEWERAGRRRERRSERERERVRGLTSLWIAGVTAIRWVFGNKRGVTVLIRVFIINGVTLAGTLLPQTNNRRNLDETLTISRRPLLTSCFPRLLRLPLALSLFSLSHSSRSFLKLDTVAWF